MFPEITSALECLYFVPLPFYEDVRDYQFPSFAHNTAVTPTPAQLEAARGLISAMDLMQGEGEGAEDNEDEDGAGELLQPEQTFNPVLQRFYQCVERRALDESAEVSELDPLIARYVNPDKATLKASEGPFKAFKAAFQLRKVESKKEQKKRHWSAVYGADASLEDMDQDILAAKQLKAATSSSSSSSSSSGSGGGSGGDAMADDLKFEDIVATRVDKIGSVDPVKDFNTILDRRSSGDEVDMACAQMADMVKQLVNSAFNGDAFPKAIDCMVAFRLGCVMHEEPSHFNNALTEYKQLYCKKIPDFWQMVVEEGIFPINNSEVGHSKFTPEEARKFLDVAAPAPAQQAAAVDDDDDDDLWGSMN
mmetsp:Transcript_12730/g.24528  ORF Transcript_12730/g.24528 Transcript_12730/m.24528 type:complete len:364 (+) Transcript_12730:377-1468(+)